MKELRELVRQYIAGDMPFADFRRSMVVQFLTARNAEAAAESVSSAIDVDCSDFSEGMISEEQLKRSLVSRVQPSAQGISAVGPVLFLADYDISVAVAPSVAFPIAASGTLSGAVASSPISFELVHA